MGLSNYEIMRNRMRGEFVKYDQEKMIRKFQLSFDDKYLYLEFVGRDYRIGRKTGIVEWSEDAFQSAAEADYNESMTLYDILCYAKETCSLSGKFCPLHAVKGSAKTFYVGDSMFQQTAEKFRGHRKELEAACEILGRRMELAGDLAAELRAFPFLPVIFQYWEADEEFPPLLKFMYDENILEYMHFETVYLMTAHILRRLEEHVLH